MSRTWRNRHAVPKGFKVRDGIPWAAYDSEGNEYYFDSYTHTEVKYRRFSPNLWTWVVLSIQPHFRNGKLLTFLQERFLTPQDILRNLGEVGIVKKQKSGVSSVRDDIVLEYATRCPKTFGMKFPKKRKLVVGDHGKAHFWKNLSFGRSNSKET